MVDVVWHLGDVELASYLGRYRLLKTLLIVLPIVFPPCILLASASSKADWVTEASSRSLKLLPMLGVPSLPSLEYPFCFSSAVLRGDSGPEGCLRPLDDGLDMKAAEFSDESELDDF